MDNWQPIETAPNDGTVVRVRQGKWQPVHASQKNGRWTFIDYDHPAAQNLTHWQNTTPPMEAPRG